MAYSDFSLAKVKKTFGLTEKMIPLFQDQNTIEPSQWLQETLNISLKVALSSSSEKARSEFIIAPILLEMEKRNHEAFAIFSGERLDLDDEQGLKGECDFILSKGPISTTIQTPIFSLVEAKKNDVKEGLGQCVAQMLGANIYNQQQGNDIDVIYGCVTTGEDWQFLRLENNTIFIDSDRYYINNIGRILWIFQYIIDYNG